MSLSDMPRSQKMRIILCCVILILDLAFLPWLINFPFFAMRDMSTAPTQWLAYGPIKSWLDVFRDSNFKNLFLFLQIPIVTGAILILWDTDRFKKKNKIQDGLGGPEPSGAGQHGTARWQNEKEMDKTAKVWYSDTELDKGGVTFGMNKIKGREKIWLNDKDMHTLIIGATRSGKSKKIILPTIWELAKAEESMVIGDPKGELYISSKDFLLKKGYKVIALNLREPRKGNQWNMLHLANQAFKKGDIPRAVEIAWDIASSIISKESAKNTEPIWINGAQSVVATLIITTIMDAEFDFQKHMGTVYYLLSELAITRDDGTVPLNDLINKLPRRHPARDAFASARVSAQKTRESFFSSVLAELRLFSDPNIQNMTSMQDHSLEAIGIEKTAVFLIIPDEKETRNVLATLYVDQVYQAMVDLSNTKGGRIPRRVNILLDEFGNLPPLPRFTNKLTVGGGRGVRFTIAIQDIAQLKELYDKKAQTITGNCHNWIYLKTADLDTAKLITGKMGKYTVETDNLNSSIQKKGYSISQGKGLTGRDLLTPDEILRWNTDYSLVLPVSDFPARYPCPDLSQYMANIDFGFVQPSGDVDEDSRLNNEINMNRWINHFERPYEEVKVWTPDIYSDDDESENQELENIENNNPEILEINNENTVENALDSYSEEDDDKAFNIL